MFLKTRKTTKIVMIIQIKFFKQQSSMSLVVINFEIKKIIYHNNYLF